MKQVLAKAVRKIDLAPMVNPRFRAALLNPARNVALKGGRGSTKSSAISLYLVASFLGDKRANAVIMRKVANTLELSVFEQIKWAIYELGVESQFKFTKSPRRITHIKTGTAFYFAGVDDPQKLKSMIIAKGYVRWLWFEELAEFDNWAEIDTVRLSFTRKKLPPHMHVRTFYSWNPPRNPYDWIVDWAEQRKTMPGWLVDHSTYLDDVRHFLSDDYTDEIATVKANDPEYYAWQYLGRSVGLGTNVYNMSMFHPIKELFGDDPISRIAYSVDGGHAQSATTDLAFGITTRGKVVLLDTFYYSPAGKAHKRPPSELARNIHDWIRGHKESEEWGKRPILHRTIDSAEAALRNQYDADYHIAMHPVAKLKKQTMIDYVYSLLADGRFYYIDKPANAVFVEQHRDYRYEEKTLNSDDPRVIKENDHTCDAFQYFVLDNRLELKLKG
jgi:phage terminase large subunit